MAGIKGKSGRKDHSTGGKAGRKLGSAEKTEILYGCRFSKEEYQNMMEILEEIKTKKGLTKSEILYQAILNLKEE